MHHSRRGKYAYLIRIQHRYDEPVVGIDRLGVLVIGIHVDGLAISEPVSYKYQLLYRRLGLLIDRLRGVLYGRLARRGIFLFDGLQITDEYLVHIGAGFEYVPVVLDILQCLSVLLHQSVHLKPDELLQTHFKYSCCLSLRKPQLIHQPLARLCHDLGCPEYLYDLIYDIAGTDEPLLYLASFLRPGQEYIVLSGCVFILKFQIVGQYPPQIQRLGSALDYRQHIDAEGVLQLRLLVQDIFDALRVGILFQLQHDPDAVVIRLIADIRHLRQDLLICQLRHVLQELADPGSDHRIRDLGDHQPVLVTAPDSRLVYDSAAQSQLARACGIYRLEIGFVGYDTSRREVRSLQYIKELRHGALPVSDICDACIAYLTQIVRRYGRAHADRDAVRTVDEKIGHSDRQHHRLTLLLVIVRDEIDRLVEILEIYLLGELLKSRLRISHRRRLVALYGAEVAVSLDERHALLPRLREHDQSLIQRGVSVRVVLTHRISDYPRRLTVGLVMIQMKLRHIIEHSALHRLEPVPRVRDSPCRDHAHGVVQI